MSEPMPDHVAAPEDVIRSAIESAMCGEWGREEALRQYAVLLAERQKRISMNQALNDQNGELEEQRDTALRRIADWQAVAADARAQVQQLREALERIAHVRQSDSSAGRLLREIDGIARAALGERSA